MIFQAVLLLVIFAVLVAGLIRARRQHRSVVLTVCWGFVWTLAAVLVWKPEITSRVAGWVGIGRGSDLVFYIAIISLTAIVLSLLVWVDSLDERMTKLIQQLAIDDYERTKTTSSGRDHHPDV